MFYFYIFYECNDVPVNNETFYSSFSNNYTPFYSFTALLTQMLNSNDQSGHFCLISNVMESIQ